MTDPKIQSSPRIVDGFGIATQLAAPAPPADPTLTIDPRYPLSIYHPRPRDKNREDANKNTKEAIALEVKRLADDREHQAKMNRLQETVEPQWAREDVMKHLKALAIGAKNERDRLTATVEYAKLAGYTAPEAGVEDDAIRRLAANLDKLMAKDVIVE